MKYKEFLHSFNDLLNHFNTSLKPINLLQTNLKNQFEPFVKNEISEKNFEKCSQKSFEKRWLEKSNPERLHYLKNIFLKARTNELIKYMISDSPQAFQKSLLDLLKIFLLEGVNKSQISNSELFFKQKNLDLTIANPNSFPSPKSYNKSNKHATTHPINLKGNEKSMKEQVINQFSALLIKSKDTLEKLFIDPDLINLLSKNNNLEEHFFKPRLINSSKLNFFQFLKECFKQDIHFALIQDFIIRFRYFNEFINILFKFLRSAVKKIINSKSKYAKELEKERSQQKCYKTLNFKLKPSQNTETNSSLREFYKIAYNIGRSLATKLGGFKKRNKKGHVYYKQLFRKNLKFDNIPFYLPFRKQRITKPKLVLLCDISYSMDQYIKFYLSFFYALENLFSSIETFTFINCPIHVSKIIKKYPFSKAFSEIMALPEMNQWKKSNFGSTFKLFMEKFINYIDKRTIFIVAGDARNNSFADQVDKFYDISKRANTTIWLNPEPVYKWNAGDSIISHYAPSCDHIIKCSHPEELLQLERINIFSLQNLKKRKISLYSTR